MLKARQLISASVNAGQLEQDFKDARDKRNGRRTKTRYQAFTTVLGLL